jgi:ABC-type nickel/cobalt efflux system permease component RcnA
MARGVAVLGGLLVLLVVVAGPAAAHPLGNATVNRAVALDIRSDALDLTYITDMAEIPAFAALLEIDADGDGEPSASEQAAWAQGRCADAATGLTLLLDGAPQDLTRTGQPQLSFPAGVGGLETLRLVCSFQSPTAIGSGSHTVSIRDDLDDGRRGWREVTIAAGEGVELVASDAPRVSPSGQLTTYPADLLDEPLDVRQAAATARTATAIPADEPPTAATLRGAPTTPGSDALVELLGEASSPLGWMLAALLAAGLGAFHALSPGHGKTLVAAYAIGSRGTLRRSIGLGLTVAVSHTIGVFVLAGVVLGAGELLIPERVVAWLSVVSGILVMVVGISVGWRSIRARRRPAGHSHRHGSDDDHAHEHAHAHPHKHDRDPARGSAPIREVLALGLVGGMVPSASALLVLLVALTTGRLVEGLGLIIAFGLGMAVVLAGLAGTVGLARTRLATMSVNTHRPRLRGLAANLPLASALLIVVAGTVVTLGALGNL